MAKIYDMATGAIIAGEQNDDIHAATADRYAPDARLQTVQEATAIEDMAPVDAYMVMLQDLLKKL